VGTGVTLSKSVPWPFSSSSSSSVAIQVIFSPLHLLIYLSISADLLALKVFKKWKHCMNLICCSNSISRPMQGVFGKDS
jgi:hypothetical protein